MKNEKGQSFFEVVFAIGISSVVLIALVALSTVAIRNANYSKNKAKATELSQDLQEWIKSQKERDWGNVANRTGTWCMTNLSFSSSGECGQNEFVEDTEIRRQLVITAVSTNSLEIEINSMWTDGLGDHTVQSSTYLTRWHAK